MCFGGCCARCFREKYGFEKGNVENSDKIAARDSETVPAFYPRGNRADM